MYSFSLVKTIANIQYYSRTDKDEREKISYALYLKTEYNFRNEIYDKKRT